ncbi:hypothetical protein DPEC_G00241820 [Dallia pectoralis]|uniref:Uncharacterized protein n=1 Tax=Dallia pectoralis TaxID=75939 RepID=A0ACC2FUV7_DALPE|nr:hypothetical protein DPEC_G00241820 [Dallia pectoralis]
MPPTGRPTDNKMPPTGRPTDNKMPPTGRPTDNKMPPTGRPTDNKMPPTGRPTDNKMPPTGRPTDNKMPPTGRPTDNKMPPTGRPIDKKSLKQKVAHEIERTSAHCDSAPAKKKAHSSTTSASNASDLFEAALADANREFNMLFSEYSEVLSERAAIDASQVRELDDLLMEAKNLESHLKEKKDHLRRTLAVISDKLQG